LSDPGNNPVAQFIYNFNSFSQSKMEKVFTEGPYGVHDTFRNGLHSIAHDLNPGHPLEKYLKNNVIK
jgi:hypothetical protein